MRTRSYRRLFFTRLLAPPNLLLAVVSIFILSEQHAFAQQADTAQQAVTWEFGARKAADGSSVLVLHAHIREGWKLYSTTNPDTVGFSRVTLDKNARLKIAGLEEKGALRRKKDTLFNNAETSFFTGDVDFLVRLRPLDYNPADAAANAANAVASGKPAAPPSNTVTAASPADLKGTITFIAVKNDSVVGPTDVPFRYGQTADGGYIAKSTTLRQSNDEAHALKRASIDLANPVNSCGGTGTEDSKGFVAIFFLGVLGGLVGLIMPCTFPMIPLTVAFFLKK